MRLFVIVAALVQAVVGMHFYLTNDASQCFLEELPRDTIVVGHYRAEELETATNQFKEDNEGLGMQIRVDEVDSGHNVVNARGNAIGQFSFTSHEAGDHMICLRTNHTGGWFSGSRVRVFFDIAVGEARVNEDSERDHVHDLAAKLRELGARIHDVKREQQYQRESEATFRNASERANSKAVWWTLGQIVLLVAMCIWQLRQLKHFFEVKKLR